MRLPSLQLLQRLEDQCCFCCQRPTYYQGTEFDSVLTFSICLDDLETVHDGRLCAMAGSDPCNPVYVLYVDSCLVPEHTSPGLSADIVSIPGQPSTSVCVYREERIVEVCVRAFIWLDLTITRATGRGQFTTKVFYCKFHLVISGMRQFFVTLSLNNLYSDTSDGIIIPLSVFLYWSTK